MATFFVNQKKHKTNNTWENGILVKEAETEQGAYNLALHQFHAFMSTYGYGQAADIDYIACSVEDVDGRNIKSEIDDRRITQLEE